MYFDRDNKLSITEEDNCYKCKGRDKCPLVGSLVGGFTDFIEGELVVHDCGFYGIINGTEKPKLRVVKGE